MGIIEDIRREHPDWLDLNWVRPTPLPRKPPSVAQVTRELQEERDEILAAWGKLDPWGTDPLDFVPVSVRYWTLKQLKNRIRWLKGERGKLLGKPEKKAAIAENAAKIQRYTRELFKRYSAERMAVDRVEFNGLRRRRRARAKQRKVAALLNKWYANRKAKNEARHKSAKGLAGVEPQ